MIDFGEGVLDAFSALNVEQRRLALEELYDDFANLLRDNKRQSSYRRTLLVECLPLNPRE